VALVYQVATYIIYAGGKRLRPLLVLLAARAWVIKANSMSKRLPSRIHPYRDLGCMTTSWTAPRCAAAERLRTRCSATPRAVLVAISLLPRVSNDVMLDPDVHHENRRGRDECHRGGEVLQLMTPMIPIPTEARYIDVIQRKTARLFQAVRPNRRQLSDAPPHIEESLARFGRHIARHFSWSMSARFQADEAEPREASRRRPRGGKTPLPLIYGDAT